MGSKKRLRPNPRTASSCVYEHLTINETMSSRGLCSVPIIGSG
jgi:hypothetical protein